MIIGLSGYARTGKDEVGRILCDNFGFERRGVGDVLHAILLDLNPVVMPHDARISPNRVAKLTAKYGYDWLKDETEYRVLQQNLGDTLRATLGQDCLIDALYNTKPDRTVFTSTRHVNEADRIRENGGEVWRIVRPGVERPNDHLTETALDDYGFDLVIVNQGTLEDLEASVIAAVEGYGTGTR